MVENLELQQKNLIVALEKPLGMEDRRPFSKNGVLICRRRVYANKKSLEGFFVLAWRLMNQVTCPPKF